jgi:pimeloyl-ACP methyl ester carboxylesterase
MDIILIPGFWLDASSWAGVLPALQQAGHRTHPLTLPGLESRAADRSGITLRDHIEAVVSVVDALAGSADGIVLVGHSGGGPIAHAVADARPDRIARVVYVDSWPLGEGRSINDELPAEGDEIPLPDWTQFEAEDLVDLDDPLREAFRQRAIPMPVRVARDPQELSDHRRLDVPITVICCEFTSAMLQEWIGGGHPAMAELAAIRDVTTVDLPTGHWPQFTRPEDLAQAILASLGPP